jgi:thymidylate synthase
MTPLGLDRNNIPTRAISLMWNQRSVDTPLGLPFNIASYGLLLEIIAKVVNMVPDELIGNLGDCHIYVNQIDGVRQQLDRIPYELPTLDIHPGVLDYNLEAFESDMFMIKNYKCHPSIKMPLSN